MDKSTVLGFRRRKFELRDTLRGLDKQIEAVSTALTNLKVHKAIAESEYKSVVAVLEKEDGG